VEFVPTVWMLGWVRIRLAGQQVNWKLGNALHADISRADVVFLYVTPHLMASLEDKFDRELRPGTVVIANTFRFPRRKPEREVQAAGKTVRRYVWGDAAAAPRKGGGRRS
jgi:hypothetical protein